MHSTGVDSRRSPLAAAAKRSGSGGGGSGSGGSGSGGGDGDDDAWQPEPGAQQGTPRRLKMVVAYDGSEFAGFQFQPKARTVQGELERCAKRLFLGCSRMVGASRTDGGAHAYGQVVHFDVYGSRDSLETDCLYYNGFLPPDVRVLSLAEVEQGFDSHFSSLGKTYVYKLAAGLPDPMQSRYRWWVYDRWCERSRGKPSRLSEVELDVAAMARAGSLLLGRHDFSAFMDRKRPAGLGSAKRKNPKLAEKGIKPERTAAKNTRILVSLEVTEGVSAVSGGQEVDIRITGNGFLYRMVRMLAAGLVEVGHGRTTPEGLYDLLKRCDRSALPEAAPPHGLYLERAHFRGDAAFESRIQQLSAHLEQQQQQQQQDQQQEARREEEEQGGAVGVEALLRELRLTQGQKAAQLMHAAAAARGAGVAADMAAGAVQGAVQGAGGGGDGAAQLAAAAAAAVAAGGAKEPEEDYSRLGDGGYEDQ